MHIFYNNKRDYSFFTIKISVKSLIKPFFIFLSISVKIKIKLSRTNETKSLEIKTAGTVEDVLKKMNLKPDTIIVMNKTRPVPIDSQLNDGEELTIIQVASGG
jgi:sulfur carrier protein ThiS